MATKVKTKKKKVNKTTVKPKIIVIAVAVCVLIAIIISIISLVPNHPKAEIYNFNKKKAQGVDVSEHNGEIDWAALSKEFDFAFVRVGYRGYGENGVIAEDKYARKNLEEANKAGIPVGVYFYSQATTEKEAQKEASFAIKIAKKYKIDLPIMMDFEYPCDSNGNQVGRLADAELTADDNAKIINAFFDIIEDKGYSFGLYASSSVLHNRISMNKLDNDAVIWAADYNSKVTFDVDYTVWQYSEKGKSKAVSSKYVDLNYWFSNK